MVMGGEGVNYFEEFKKSILYRMISRIIMAMGVVISFILFLLEVPFSVNFCTITIFILSSYYAITKFVCPKCGKKLQVTKSLDEYKYCPHCGEHIYIPQNDENISY